MSTKLWGGSEEIKERGTQLFTHLTMSPEQIDKIEYMLNLIEAGLYLDNLNKLIPLSNDLSQESEQPLLFYTLKHIFLDLAEALEGEAVDSDKFINLTRNTRCKTADILRHVRAEGSIRYQQLQELVVDHITNSSLSRGARNTPGFV